MYRIFFFKQKTAYEMRISDWSSDVCSSDLALTEQRSLFDPWLPPGLSYREEAIGADEEKELIQHIDQADLAPFRFQQWTGKRRTRSFGWTYDFTTGRFAPADPIPDWLTECRERAAQFAGLAPEQPSSEEHTSELQSLTPI